MELQIDVLARAMTATLVCNPLIREKGFESQRPIYKAVIFAHWFGVMKKPETARFGPNPTIATTLALIGNSKTHKRLNDIHKKSSRSSWLRHGPKSEIAEFCSICNVERYRSMALHELVISNGQEYIVNPYFCPRGKYVDRQEDWVQWKNFVGEYQKNWTTSNHAIYELCLTYCAEVANYFYAYFENFHLNAINQTSGGLLRLMNDCETMYRPKNMASHPITNALTNSLFQKAAVIGNANRQQGEHATKILEGYTSILKQHRVTNGVLGTPIKPHPSWSISNLQQNGISPRKLHAGKKLLVRDEIHLATHFLNSTTNILRFTMQQPQRLKTLCKNLEEHSLLSYEQFAREWEQVGEELSGRSQVIERAFLLKTSRSTTLQLEQLGSVLGKLYKKGLRSSDKVAARLIQHIKQMTSEFLIGLRSAMSDGAWRNLQIIDLENQMHEFKAKEEVARERLFTQTTMAMILTFNNQTLAHIAEHKHTTETSNSFVVKNMQEPCENLVVAALLSIQAGIKTSQRRVDGESKKILEVVDKFSAAIIRLRQTLREMSNAEAHIPIMNFSIHNKQALSLKGLFKNLDLLLTTKNQKLAALLQETNRQDLEGREALAMIAKGNRFPQKSNNSHLKKLCLLLNQRGGGGPKHQQQQQQQHTASHHRNPMPGNIQILRRIQGTLCEHHSKEVVKMLCCGG